MDGRKKGLELFKTLLLMLLIAVSLFLTARIWFYDASVIPMGLTQRIAGIERLFGLDTAPAVTGGVRDYSYTAAALPVKYAVTLSDGRRGGEYGASDTKTLYGMAEVPIGEAIGSAGAAEKADENGWRAALSGEGLYLEYAYAVPLDTLAHWSGVETSGNLTAFTKKLLLSASGEFLTIWYKDNNNAVFTAATAVPSSKLMRKIEGVEPNGCRFAFECEGVYSGLQSEFFCFDSEQVMPKVAVSVPEVDEQGFEGLLRIFSINPLTNSRYTSADGARHAISGARSLILGSDGLLIYSDNAPEAGEGVTLGTGDMPEEALIEAFRQIAAGTAGAQCGAAELCLKSVRFDEDSGSYTAVFAWIVSGAAVYCDNGDEAAVFRASGGKLVSARISLRCFNNTNVLTELIPADRAAFLAEKLGGSELGITYFCSGNSAEAKWSYR